MPYSEQELRETLAEHGGAPSPRDGLAARAEAGGRRVRRRRRAAAVTVTAAAVAAAVVVPQALPGQGTTSHLSDSQTPAGARERGGDVESARVVLGTVVRLAPLPAAHDARPSAFPDRALVEVRVTRTLRGGGSAGETIAVGTGPTTSIEKIRRLLPAGTSVLAFLDRARDVTGKGQSDASGRPLWSPGSRGLILANEKGSPPGSALALSGPRTQARKSVHVTSGLRLSVLCTPRLDGDALVELGCRDLTPAQSTKVNRACPGLTGRIARMTALSADDLRCLGSVLA
ncbi:hypothetical protein [Actinomadura hibisca]|uniref:hypothetical protein n=1 Tax=Actinomadura hibisca TaxID=68565 RepID=UPI00082CD0F5|nr:hypothetical protein [Actinomadura hibisca]